MQEAPAIGSAPALASPHRPAQLQSHADESSVLHYVYQQIISTNNCPSPPYIVLNPDQSVGLAHCAPHKGLFGHNLEGSTGEGQEVLILQLSGYASVLGAGAQAWVALRRGQLVPASSAVDLLQDTAELISEAGGTSVKAYLRKGKMLHGREE